MQIWTILIAAIASAGSIHAAIKMNQDKFDRFVMGIVRDVGRHKARKRRFNTSKGLMVTLLRQDDPMEDLMISAEDEDESNLSTYTKAELIEFGDGLDGRPILISIFGRVYDVTAGSKFYGTGGPYASFAGHDVTYSLSTGCRTRDCLERSAEGLEEKLLKEGKRWLSFFHLHDKYHLVGTLEFDYMDIMMSDLVDDGIANGVGKPLKPPIFKL